MELPPGAVLQDRYTILEPVTRGGMGAIYKVRDARLAGALCALKLMLEPEDHVDAAATELRFAKEMEVLGGLRHDGIPRVLDFFRHEGSYCIIMDFIAGQNLEQICNGEPLQVPQVLDIAEQVLDILSYLHSQNPPVVHRDIKPANLILEGQTHRIKLVDFGLARLHDKQSHTMAGTPGFAPIEQFHGESEPRSDLFALGATMEYLLTARRPRAFERDPVKDTLRNSFPPLRDLIGRALEVSPADRYASAQAMRRCLLEVRHQLESPSWQPDAPARDRILIVDDDQVTQMVVADVLESEHFEVHAADNGECALEMALQIHPDLVISDVDMPGFDGITLVEKLRQHRQTRSVPVILLTGSTVVSDESRALEAGAEDFVLKPIIPERLLARVRAVLRRSRRAAE